MISLLKVKSALKLHYYYYEFHDENAAQISAQFLVQKVEYMGHGRSLHPSSKGGVLADDPHAFVGNSNRPCILIQEPLLEFQLLSQLPRPLKEVR